MQLSIGKYLCPANGAEVTTRTDTEFSYSGLPLRYIATLSAKVYLDGDGQDALSVAENQLRDTLAVPYQDVVFWTDTNKVSSTALLNKGSISGVRLVSGPNFTEAQGGEYVNRRTCEFEMAAEYVIKNAATAVVSWTETVSIQGNGGPQTVWRFPLNANPIRQVVTPYSLVRATQSGAAVGHTSYPTRPLPIWPEFLLNPSDGGTFDTPEPKGRGYVNFGIHWSYSFEVGGVPLVGLPSLPPLR